MQQQFNKKVGQFLEVACKLTYLSIANVNISFKDWCWRCILISLRFHWKRKKGKTIVAKRDTRETLAYLAELQKSPSHRHTGPVQPVIRPSAPQDLVTIKYNKLFISTIFHNALFYLALGSFPTVIRRLSFCTIIPRQDTYIGLSGRIAQW